MYITPQSATIEVYDNTGLPHNTTDRYCFYLPEEMFRPDQLSVFQPELIFSASSSIVFSPLSAS